MAAQKPMIYLNGLMQQIPSSESLIVPGMTIGSSAIAYPSAAAGSAVLEMVGTTTNFRVASDDGSGTTILYSNAFYNTAGSVHRYIKAGPAFRMAFSATGFKLSVAASGAANATITWIEALNTDLVGNTTIGGSITGKNASDLVSGTLLDALLPTRFGTLSGGAAITSNWNLSLAFGCYYSVPGPGTNAPNAIDFWYGYTLPFIAGQHASQIAYMWDNTTTSLTTNTYRRDQSLGAWGGWYQVDLSLAEMTAIFQPIQSYARQGIV
jgi:hypothetical protein